MATTLAEIKGLLEAKKIKFGEVNEHTLVLWYGTEKYTDSDGDKALKIAIELTEDGEYIRIFSPKAFTVSGANVPAFLQACMEIQWKTKLIQFEYDRNDGEIRPIIEFPIEDSALTPRQLYRCILGIVKIIDEYYLVLMKALNEGVVDFPVVLPPPDMMNNMMLMLMEAARSGQLTPEQRAMLQSLSGSGDAAPSEL